MRNSVIIRAFLVFFLARHKLQNAAAEQDMKVMLSLARCAILDTDRTGPSFC